MRTLTELRDEIDKLDNDLLKTLSERIDIVNEIGKLKKSNKINLLDSERKAKVLQNWLNHPVSKLLPESVIQKLYEVVHEISIEIEKK